MCYETRADFKCAILTFPLPRFSPGAEGGIAAADLQEELMAMFISPEKVYKDDVALVLEDYMDTHFKTICDDGSPDELGELLCTLWRKCCEGDFSMCDQLHAQTISRSAVTNISVSQSTGLHAGDAIDSDSDGSDEDNDAAERMLHEAYREARAGAGAGGDLGSIDEHDEGGEMDTETSAPALEPLEPLVDKEGFETVVVGKKKKAYKKV